MSEFFYLGGADGHEAIECDANTWAEKFDRKNRIVKQEHAGQYWVSTVFLGLDHNYAREMTGVGEPLIFETMAFGSRDVLDEIDCERCSTWAQAIAQHDAMVASLRQRVQ